jgi:putative two-component system response regulator
METMTSGAEQRGRIVIADDLPANIDLIERILCRDGHRVYRASDGDETLSLVERTLPDLVLLDVMMPARSGFEVCATLKADPLTRLIPVVLITALNDSPDRIRGLDAGADDFLTKPVNPAELQARVRSLLRLKRYTDDLDSAETTILSLAQTIEARDPSTEGHCQRLASYGTIFGDVLGMPAEDIEALKRGGVLHDIGKVGIPDAILLKPGPLTPEEFRTMQQHTLIGDRLCATFRSLKRVRPIVRNHHERLDGTGYPDRLSGDQIPLLAQVIGLVDVFDALTTERPYKRAMTIDQACDELVREARRGWRRMDLVETFSAIALAGRLPVTA